MQNFRNSSNTLILIFTLVICQNVLAENCLFDSLNLILKQKLIGIDYKSKIVSNMNIFLPSCREMENKFDPSTCNAKYINNALDWINSYFPLRQCGCDSIIFLPSFNNKDDRIISVCADSCRSNLNQIQCFYAQIIDGRSLTVLLIKEIDLEDVKNRPFNVIVTNRLIDWEIMAPSKFLNVEISTAGKDYIEGHITTDSTYCYSNIPYKFSPTFWCNKNCIIFNFPKIHYPKRSVFGYDPNMTLGGIPADDPKPFIRFKNENKTDLSKEMIKLFPWVLDSLNKWKKETEYYK